MYFAVKVNSKIIRLISYISQIHYKYIIGISISLILGLSILGTFLDFSYSFKSWAKDLANQQLSFDIRAIVDNNDLGKRQLSTLLENPDVRFLNEYYITTGKINSKSTYIIAESETSKNSLKAIYGESVPFDNLLEDEIILTDRLLRDLNLKIGDSVKISIDNSVKELTIVSSFETQDYSSYMVILSEHSYPNKYYNKYTINIRLNNSTILSDLKSKLKSDNITFLDKDEITAQWAESIVSSIEILVSILLLIIISLVIILNNIIKNSITNRKHDFSILRTIGFSKSNVSQFLFTELLLFQAPIVIFSLIITPFISFNFLKLNYYISGYNVDYKINILGYTLVWGIVAMILFLQPIKIFLNIKNDSPIDSLNNL